MDRPLLCDDGGGADPHERRVSLEQRSREIYGKAEEMGREAMEKGREMYDRAWERLERYL